MFVMSTDAFSSQHTSSVIEPALRFLFPNMAQGEIDTIHFVIRKSAHVGEYFVLGLLLFRAFASGLQRYEAVSLASLSFAVGILFAVSDEFHQSFVSSRHASVLDIGLDSLGIMAAQVIVVLRQHFIVKRAV